MKETLYPTAQLHKLVYNGLAAFVLRLYPWDVKPRTFFDQWLYTSGNDINPVLYTLIPHAIRSPFVLFASIVIQFIWVLPLPAIVYTNISTVISWDRILRGSESCRFKLESVIMSDRFEQFNFPLFYRAQNHRYEPSPFWFSFLGPSSGSILSDFSVVQNRDCIVCSGFYIWLYEAKRG